MPIRKNWKHSLFQASSSIEYGISLASFLHSVQQIQTCHPNLRVNRCNSNMMHFSCLLFLIATVDVPTVSEWVWKKNVNLTFCVATWVWISSLMQIWYQFFVSSKLFLVKQIFLLYLSKTLQYQGGLTFWSNESHFGHRVHYHDSKLSAEHILKFSKKHHIRNSRYWFLPKSLIL